MKTLFNGIVALGMLLSLFGGIPPQTRSAAAWEGKVDPWVLATSQQGETEFLVFLRDQADLRAAATLGNKAARGRFVYQTLTETAARSQGPLLAHLRALGVEHRAFWVVNAIWVRGDAALVQALAQRPEVAHLYANPRVQMKLPAPEALASPTAVASLPWNLLQIGANDVWAAGYRGQGVVLGGADTGYEWDHPALIRQYRGWDGAAADHDYNWFDATGLSPAIPVDPHGHGTHTMGIMVGDDGGDNRIGVAPAARWIGCRNMDASGYGTPARYIGCYQWFIAPTRTDGSDPRPDLAPVAINNSWGCPTSEGCTDPTVLLTAVQNVRAAGILTAHSAGNDGYLGCSTIQTPAAIYAESFTVGSTNSLDEIAGSSSRGPVTVDGSNRLKPNISAPGVGIYSSYKNDSYVYLSGTSMAAPHVAGVVALLISANPALTGQVETLETLIEQSALPHYTDDGCGGDTPTSHPNHTYGWGRVDAWAVFQHHELIVSKTASSALIVPGAALTYTLTVTHTAVMAPTAGVTVSDTLPAGAEFVAASKPYTLTDRVIFWPLGDLDPLASRQVTLTVRAPFTTKLEELVNAQYGAASTGIPPVSGAPVTTPIQKLAVEKSASAVVLRGGLLTYTLRVENLQPVSVTHNVALTDTLPANTSFVSATGAPTLTGALLSWAPGDLEPKQSRQETLVVRVDSAASGMLVNADYGAASDEVSEGVRGAAVITLVHAPGVMLLDSDSQNLPDRCDPTNAAIYEHFLINTGNYTDTFTLNLASSQGWAVSEAESFVLAAGETVAFSVTVQPLCPAVVGSVDITTVTATSQADGGVTASISDTTTILDYGFLPVIFGKP